MCLSVTPPSAALYLSVSAAHQAAPPPLLLLTQSWDSREVSSITTKAKIIENNKMGKQNKKREQNISWDICRQMQQTLTCSEHLLQPVLQRRLWKRSRLHSTTPHRFTGSVHRADPLQPSKLCPADTSCQKVQPKCRWNISEDERKLIQLTAASQTANNRSWIHK